MSKQLRLEHALHNEEACNALTTSGAFNDWVVTTAFYSSLHFVKHKMFPLTTTHPESGNQTVFTNFEEYYNTTRRFIKKNKHDTVLELVKKEIPEVKTEYRVLKDLCMSARYNSYIVSDETAEKARMRLGIIKSACITVPEKKDKTDAGVKVG